MRHVKDALGDASGYFFQGPKIVRQVPLGASIRMSAANLVGLMPC
jgi:hypothetical protein